MSNELSSTELMYSSAILALAIIIIFLLIIIILKRSPSGKSRFVAVFIIIAIATRFCDGLIDYASFHSKRVYSHAKSSAFSFFSTLSFGFKEQPTLALELENNLNTIEPAPQSSASSSDDGVVKHDKNTISTWDDWGYSYDQNHGKIKDLEHNLKNSKRRKSANQIAMKPKTKLSQPSRSAKSTEMPQKHAAPSPDYRIEYEPVYEYFIVRK